MRSIRHRSNSRLAAAAHSADGAQQTAAKPQPVDGDEHARRQAETFDAVAESWEEDHDPEVLQVHHVHRTEAWLCLLIVPSLPHKRADRCMYLARSSLCVWYVAIKRPLKATVRSRDRVRGSSLCVCQASGNALRCRIGSGNCVLAF